MGSGSYSFSASTTRAAEYTTMSASEIFTKRSVDSLMNPRNTVRECRDSADHPNTVPIIIALDVTGSMGYVPDRFIRNEMNKMMAALFDAGVKDAQVLFMGIGDHECDSAPLQVGQFEADDQLLDKWLKSIYLEGGGGGNAGESYLLAWKYAADNTILDSVEKRGTKGFLFTIGDEPTLKSLPGHSVQRIFGAGQNPLEDAHELLASARKKYVVKHIHLTETGAGSRVSTQNGWKQLIGDDLIILPSYDQIAQAIANVVKGNVRVETNSLPTQSPVKNEAETML